MRPLVLLFAMTTLVGGCVRAYYTRPGTLKPSMATVAPTERAAVWQHAVSALLDQGYVPQVLNEAAGYISARRRDDLADDALIGTMATVMVSADGPVRVEVSGTGIYSSEQDFLQAVTERQSQIMQAVLAGRPPTK
jgi:hypothetical protein